MKPSFLPVPSRFNEKKATQAAARFLHLAGGRLNYMVLIKLLYLLDRTALTRWGRPVTGAEYYSMKLGPVLSEVLDLITDPSEDDAGGYWATHISEASHFYVELMSDPGSEKLSEAENVAIQEAFSEYEPFSGLGQCAPFRFADHLHDVLPEWTKVESGRVPLPIADILKAKQFTQADIASIEDELSSVADVHRMFAASR